MRLAMQCKECSSYTRGVITMPKKAENIEKRHETQITAEK
jgi:hypothetical protein